MRLRSISMVVALLAGAAGLAAQADKLKTPAALTETAPANYRAAFDTSAGKPRIQARKQKEGPWEDIAVLESYPDSTPARPGRGLRNGAPFEVRFPPVSIYALRIIGKPASGDNPSQSFASCADLQAFER